LLEKSNTTLEITDWLIYFANTILKAQEDTLKRIDYLIEKTKFFDSYSSQPNEQGGLSANNYQTIAKASASTTTRDLQDFGLLKSTRYFLNIEPFKPTNLVN
jgi:Fic family protein